MCLGLPVELGGLVILGRQAPVELLGLPPVIGEHEKHRVDLVI